MHFTTLVSIVLATLPLAVFGTGGHSTSTGTICETITTYQPGYVTTCAVPACLEIKYVTQHCGCYSIPTITLPVTGCPPIKCAGTSYITAIEDCFPTSTPPSSSSHSSTPTLTSSTTTTTTSSSASSTKSSSSTPSSTGSSSSSTSSSSTTKPSSSTTTPPVTTPYTNSTITKTKTETEITTLTTCPASVICTGQTVTYTSTEVCPTTTCTCVLPAVTYTTTFLPQGATTVTKAGNTPPSPTSSARPSFSEASGAGKVEAGVGALGAVVLALLGML